MHPIIFQSKYLIINTFWLFFLIAVIVSATVLIKTTIRNGLKLQFLSDHSGILILWSLVGARLFSLVENYSIYLYKISNETFLSIFYIWDKGLNFWGAAIFFFACLYFICKKQDQDFWKWADALTPAIILGIGISSLGAFFEGINYGKETSMPWGVNFESPVVKYTVPIHPTQIYAFIYCILLSIAIIFVPLIKKIKELYFPSATALASLSLYGFLKFFEEFFRGDDVWMILGIRLPQIFSLIIAISTGTFLYIRYNNHTKKNLHNTHNKNSK